jgi:hypothetical protein
MALKDPPDFRTTDRLTELTLHHLLQRRKRPQVSERNLAVLGSLAGDSYDLGSLLGRQSWRAAASLCIA